MKILLLFFVSLLSIVTQAMPVEPTNDAQSIVAGYVNGDGPVTNVDVTALYNYLLNDDNAARVNGCQDGDDLITSVDVTMVYNILLGQ